MIKLSRPRANYRKMNFKILANFLESELSKKLTIFLSKIHTYGCMRFKSLINITIRRMNRNGQESCDKVIAIQNPGKNIVLY